MFTNNLILTKKKRNFFCFSFFEIYNPDFTLSVSQNTWQTSGTGSVSIFRREQ